jgi:hypothetical protein
MARHETDREDLLREATALVERAELIVAGSQEPVTLGFRRNGALSLFFGADPVYQFTAEGLLRRAFVSGLLFKAEGGWLIELRRERSDSSVSLVRRKLNEAEQQAFLVTARARCDALFAALSRFEFELVGQVPADGAVVNRAIAWRDEHPGPFAVARSPEASHPG